MDFRRYLKYGFIGASGRTRSAFATPPIPFWYSSAPGMADADEVSTIAPLITVVALHLPERPAAEFSSELS